MVLLLLVVGSCLVAEAKHQLCVHPPAWTFYDIASHYADTGNLSRSSLSSPVLTTNSTASSSSSSSSIILESNASYFRSPLQQIRGNITLVVLTNMKELTKRNEQQISNLELIYRSMRTANFSDIRFVLINSKDAFSPSWVHSIRGQVSFEVYQELESNPIWSQLDGGNGDMFIYDRCGLLTYYIPFPLSFIHTQQPILQAALLATYFESPCREVCNTTAQPNAVTTTSANVTVVTANDTSNELNVSSKPHLSSPLNETSGTILLKVSIISPLVNFALISLCMLDYQPNTGRQGRTTTTTTTTTWNQHGTDSDEVFRVVSIDTFEQNLGRGARQPNNTEHE